MDNLQNFTAALDARLGQLRIDVLNDFAAAVREEEKSFFDSVPSTIPYPIAGIALNQFNTSAVSWEKEIGHDNIGGHEVEKGAAFDEELKASAETFISRVKEAQGIKELLSTLDDLLKQALNIGKISIPNPCRNSF